MNNRNRDSQAGWLRSVRERTTGRSARVVMTMAALALAALPWSPALAIALEGKVQTPEGKPVPNAMIRVESATATATVTKVFSDKEGRYRVPDLGDNVHVNSIYVSASRLGFEQQQPEERALTALRPRVEDGVAYVDFVLSSVDNVADQVSASAWLNRLPAGPARDHTVTTCTQCHAVPDMATRQFAAGLAGSSVEQREQAWRGMIAFMRQQSYAALQSEHANITPEMKAAMTKPENSLINQADEDLLAPWLAENMPTNFDEYPVEVARKWHAPLGVNKNTVIRQYRYPEKSFVRETAVMNGRIWGVDIQRNRLGELRPETGAWLWHDVEAVGPVGPHTINPGPDGQKLWVTLLELGTRGMVSFEPDTGEWRIYDGFPEGTMAHDASPGQNYRLATDPDGYIWFTVISHNQVIGLDPDTGELTESYDLPLPEDETPHHVTVYGGALSSDGNYWFAQYNGGIGRFNTRTREVDYYVELDRGAGAHRMAIGEKNRLYVGLLGAGEILVYDTDKVERIKRVKLPDPSAGVYAVNWDPVRNVVWVSTTNNDSLLQYNPRTDEFLEYPLRIPGHTVRMIAVDQDSGDLWIANSPLPSRKREGEQEKRWVYSVHPGDL